MSTLQDINTLLSKAMNLSKSAGLSITGIRILILLRQENSPMRVTELAEYLNITQQAVGKVLRQMEGNKFIKCRVDKTDHRAKLTEIRGAGKLKLYIVERTYSAAA